MAKSKMLCPFTQGFCIECGQYRGRHYYLCDCEKYRGYLPPEPGIEKREVANSGPVSVEEVTRGLKYSGCLSLDDLFERSGE